MVVRYQLEAVILLNTLRVVLSNSTKPRSFTVITITAVIRAKLGAASQLKEALLSVANYVEAHEPDTIGFYLSQSIEDPSVFTTFERFTDEEAKDRHNNSPATTAFFQIADDLIAPPVTLVTSEEFSSKS